MEQFNLRSLPPCPVVTQPHIHGPRSVTTSHSVSHHNCNSPGRLQASTLKCQDKSAALSTGLPCVASHLGFSGTHWHKRTRPKGRLRASSEFRAVPCGQCPISLLSLKRASCAQGPCTPTGRWILQLCRWGSLPHCKHVCFCSAPLCIPRFAQAVQ